MMIVVTTNLLSTMGTSMATTRMTTTMRTMTMMFSQMLMSWRTIPAMSLSLLLLVVPLVAPTLELRTL